MTAARAAAAEPRHIRGGAGRGARVRPRRPQRRAVQTVEIPERVYRGSHYSDAFIKAWAKMAALDVDTNPEHCNAHVSEMARFCGLSLRDFQRALTEGRHSGPDGGLPEFSTRRMTRKSGKGRTAIRQVRPVVDGERYVTVSVAMCDALEPRRLRAALLMAHTAKYQPGYQPTAAELAAELFHHHGKSAGKPLSERTARRIVHDLESTGWVSVGHRTGHQGRHTVVVNSHPILAEQLALDLDTPATPAVDDPAAAGQGGEASADNHGGSGPATGGGSLAIKEDHGVPTDEVVARQEIGGSRRRRVTVGEPAIDAADLADGTFGPGVSRAPRGTRPTPKATGKTPYGGPELRWTERIHTSLAPVRHLLQQPDVNRFLLRKAAREIGRQLDQAAHNLMTPDRMAARIATRYRDAGPIRDIAAWLLAVGIPAKGCGLPLCENGQLWPTGETCEACATNRQVTGEHWRQARALQDRLDEARARRATDPDPLPAKATYRQRATASDAEVLAVAAAHGPEAALHRYGVLRAAPVLRAQYSHLPAAVGSTPPRPPQPVPCARPMEEAPMPDHGYMPEQIRAQLGRTKDTGALAIACPQPGCLAEAGQPCTTGRGRRRDPHDARTTAARTRGEES